MPLTFDEPTSRPFNSYMPELEPAVPPSTPDFNKEVLPAAANEVNIIKNIYDLSQRKQFKEDPLLNLPEQLKARNLWDDRELYLGVKSGEEITYRKTLIDKQRSDAEVLSRAGTAGTVAMIGMGILDPSIAIPFIKGATLARTAVKAAATMAAISSVEELVFTNSRFEHTTEDAAFNIGAATILGGVLGGALHGLLHGTSIEKMADDMAIPPRGDAISEPIPSYTEPSTAGAYQVTGEGGKLATETVTKPVIDQLSKISPLTRTIQQPHAPAHIPEGSAVARDAANKFGDAGLRLEGNKAGFSGAPGGNIEGETHFWAGINDRAQRGIEDAFVEKVFNGERPAILALQRAKLAGFLKQTETDFATFKENVFLALTQNNEHIDPHVVKAANAARKMFDDGYEEGVAVGIFTGNEKIKGDLSYVHRMFDNAKVKSDAARLAQAISSHYLAKVDADYSEKLTKLLETQAKRATEIADLKLPAEEVDALTKQFKEELQKLEDELPFDLAQIDLEAKNLREKARKTEGQGKTPLLEQARKVELSGGEDLQKHKAAKATLRARLQNLATAGVSIDKRFQAKLMKIEKNEDLQLETLLRASKQAQKVLALVEKGTDKEVAAELSKLKNMFEQTAEAFDNAEEKIVKLTNEQDQTLQGVIDKQESRMNRLDDLAARIEHVDSFDRAALQAEVDDAAKMLLETHAEIVTRRAIRNERLKAQAQKLTPEEFQAKLARKETALAQVGKDFAESFSTKTLDQVGIPGKKPNFQEHADEIAWRTVRKILGSDRRLAFSDLVQMERGPEIMRALDMPSKDLMPWLETDIQKVLTVYARTVGGDIALARQFGSASMEEVFIKLGDEEERALKAVLEGKTKKGEPLSDKEIKNRTNATTAFYKQLRNDLSTLRDRVRNTRGISTDPDAIAGRLGNAVLQASSAANLGGVVVASVQDPARIVQRKGLLRTFRDGFIPYVSQYRNFHLSARELPIAGVAADFYNNARLNAFQDIYEDAYRGTIAERGLHYVSRNIGNIAGFNQWTDFWKRMAGVVTNAEIASHIGVLVGDIKASAAETQKSVTYLAKNNITPDIAETIWNTRLTGGLQKKGNVWLPNTDLWDVSKPNVKAALRAYRSALANEVNNTIITPGLEQPSFKDANLAGRIVGQFKSFAFSSTQKTLMAGLQEHDAAYIQGMMISLAMGAFSYYLYASSTGGKTEEKMRQAIADGNWQLWADEAISRSGQTAIFDSAQRLMNRIPIINKYTSFSGGQVTRKYGGSLIDELAGPAFGMAKKANDIIQGFNPKQPNYGFDRHTLHLARQMMAFQNLSYTRRLLDKIENATGDAFGLQGQRQ